MTLWDTCERNFNDCVDNHRLYWELLDTLGRRNVCWGRRESDSENAVATGGSTKDG